MTGLKDILSDLRTSSGAEQLRFVVFLCLIFSLPFDIIYSSVLFITFLLCVLVDLLFEKFRAIPKQVWIFQLLYFLAAAGYFYSLNRHEASFLLERQLSMLLLPLFIPLAFKLNQIRINAALQTITLASILALLYLFAFQIQMIHFELKLPLFTTLFSGAFFNHEFSRPLKIHA
ncbi:MAG: hypothetical protein IT236_09205, partial [Bacteroidia bacterium]|nr:hypothetical protein [Bacteroidia bacterium]